jgi:hypothetical protein
LWIEKLLDEEEKGLATHDDDAGVLMVNVNIVDIQENNFNCCPSRH